MTEEDRLSNIKNLILDMASVENVNSITRDAINSGIDVNKIIDVLSDALQEIGEKYEHGEIFLSELMMAGILVTEVTKILENLVVNGRRKIIGKVVFGTVKGDIHDIGKNIVAMMLRAVCFKVIDLGVDVPAQKFVEVVKEEEPTILGISALLTSTVDEIKNVIDTLEAAGLRDKVKIMVGGRPVTKEFAFEIGADGFAENSVQAIGVAKKLAKGDDLYE